MCLCPCSSKDYMCLRINDSGLFALISLTALSWIYFIIGANFKIIWSKLDYFVSVCTLVSQCRHGLNSSTWFRFRSENANPSTVNTAFSEYLTFTGVSGTNKFRIRHASLSCATWIYWGYHFFFFWILGAIGNAEDLGRYRRWGLIPLYSGFKRDKKDLMQKHKLIVNKFTLSHIYFY